MKIKIVKICLLFGVVGNSFFEASAKQPIKCTYVGGLGAVEPLAKLYGTNIKTEISRRQHFLEKILEYLDSPAPSSAGLMARKDLTNKKNGTWLSKVNSVKKLNNGGWFVSGNALAESKKYISESSFVANVSPDKRTVYIEASPIVNGEVPLPVRMLVSKGFKVKTDWRCFYENPEGDSTPRADVNSH